MKKILIIHHHKKFGGSSKSIGEYVSSMKSNFDFEILCPYGSALDYFKKKKLKTIALPGISGVNITEIGCYKGLRLILLIRELFYFFSTYNSFKKIKNRNYDLIHLNDSNLIILAPIINNIFKKKIVCHIRTRLDNRNYLFKYIIKKIAKKYIYKFICIDQTTYSTSFNKNKSIIIYKIFNKKKKKLKNKKKLFFTIGFIGTLDFHKGFDFLMKISKELYKKDKKIKFLIAGKLSVNNFFLRKILNFLKIKKDIKSSTNNYLDQKNCTFLGNIINLEKFYEKIDVIAFPSRMNALGRPVIEASSFGIPSIVCLDKVYKDTIQNNKTGIIVKFGDIKSFMKAIFRYKNNHKLRKKNGENALKLHNLTHNYKANTVKLIKLYRSII